MAVDQFVPIFCGRSDGELQVSISKTGKEFNGPSSDQLDRVINPEDYYEPLDHDNSITIEWKRQLGVLLQKELQVQSAAPWFLMFFPENYRLYHHVRGSKGTSDAYLFGYPHSRKKKFHSALEFLPHLQWLIMGKSDDRGDCSCRHCAGDWVYKIEPMVSNESSQIANNMQGQAFLIPARVDGKASAAMPTVNFEALNRSSPSFERLPAEKAQAMSATGCTPLVRPLVPGRLPQPKNTEHVLDLRYSLCIHRTGELVWFNRGPAWGLAIIVQRQMLPAEALKERLASCHYLVQPLSHPLQYPDQKIIYSHEDLRPWLAWSVPGLLHEALSRSTFSTVDWQAVINGRFGLGDAEVDASILAAKDIDDSYSLVEPITNNTITTGERTYLAMFLGGEKLYIGDVARLRDMSGRDTGRDVMVIHQIIEKLRPNSTDINLATVFISGDIYRLAPSVSSSAEITTLTGSSALPDRMQADLIFRNKITVSRGNRSHWMLVSTSQRVSVNQIKGRWYESSTVLPILRGRSTFAADIATGSVSDVGDVINGRGDANKSPGHHGKLTEYKNGTRFRDRMEAIGRAVPPGTKLVDTPLQSTLSETDQYLGMTNVITTEPATTTAPVDIPNEVDLSRFMNIDTLE